MERNKALFIKVRFQYKKRLWANIVECTFHSILFKQIWSFKSEYEEKNDQKMGQIFLAAFLVNQ